MTLPNMRILLVAYDYPPLNSPQAIRWYYLSRELVHLGVELHVLAPDLSARDGNSLGVPTGVTMHRCNAGGMAGWLWRRQQARLSATVSESPLSTAARASRVGPATLNWKGRLHHRLERYVGHWIYPDSRGQWRASAGAALEELIDTIRPDVLICSHEPAVTLQLGLQVAGRVRAWLADLGDPVLAGYTPKRWRRRAGELEAQVCRAATLISVTTASTRELLLARHAVDPSKIFVISQGFDDTFSPAIDFARKSHSGELHLLYTGRFYSFRDPTALLEAVLELKQIRLTIASPEVKPGYLAYAARSDGRIAFLGEQPHAEVLKLQQECDVLVNIGNALSAQTPGKLYEYLGSGKPILHCYSVDDDPAIGLLDEWHRGWSCANDLASLRTLLTALIETPERLYASLVKEETSAVSAYGWSNLARRLLARCQQAVQAEES
ncbi:glycosyltransferase [Rhodanobacter umsongensis]|uniref:Glycosyltransferase n=1 Tax=Rhodanobacter umsongensis TaxID=633153 RepID=A0ABW0JLV0_9GAMM